MKKVLGIFLFFVLIFVFSRGASANEGVLNMRGSDGASCYAASVYVDGTYKILMTCRGLRIALSPERTRYVAWVVGEDNKEKRLGELVNGKMSVLTDIKFKEIYITSEEDGYGNKPTGVKLLSGNVEPIDFGKDVITPTPTPTMQQVTVTEAAKVTVTPKTTTSTQSKTDSSTGLASALSTVFKIALFGFGLLLIVVGVFSFLQRRRSL